ncbi:MAG: histidine kinase [Bacteroidales bacterium]|nr:histidine kinase [Bacteroidales bacterium]
MKESNNGFKNNFQELALEGNFSGEIVIRIAGITLISFLSVILSSKFAQADAPMWIPFIISFFRTAAIWNGSMLIIQYSVKRFSMFKETFKVIIFQITFLTLLVLFVEIANIYFLETFAEISFDKSDKINLFAGSWLITFMISAIYASVAFFIQWKTNLLKNQALSKANLEARYETLRSQVNPHFLFNSLNTLLVMVNGNQAASKYVENLSGFMRYMLNIRDKFAVLLRDELKVAQQYVYLQKSRFGDKLSVNFSIPESCFHYAIPPLSLQMIIENAIKHNVISKDNPLEVNIYVEENQYLVIENNTQPKIEKEPSTGFGLDNIRNRYLYLSGKEVKILVSKTTFTVKLPFFEVAL